MGGFPDRGKSVEMPPREPLIYRLYEIVQNYGYAYKAVLNEKFGDGIMSAIAFSTKVEKETDKDGVVWVSQDFVQKHNRLPVTGQHPPSRQVVALHQILDFSIQDTKIAMELTSNPRPYHACVCKRSEHLELLRRVSLCNGVRRLCPIKNNINRNNTKVTCFPSPLYERIPQTLFISDSRLMPSSRKNMTFVFMFAERVIVRSHGNGCTGTTRESQPPAQIWRC